MANLCVWAIHILTEIRFIGIETGKFEKIDQIGIGVDKSNEKPFIFLGCLRNSVFLSKSVFSF